MCPDVIPGNKNTSSRHKPKVPPAVSGKQAFAFMAAIKKKKEDEEKLKAERKRAREEKKNKVVKKRKTVKRKIIQDTSSEGDSSPGEVISETESEEEGCMMEPCLKAYAKWKYNDPSKWMGCGSCSRWFHRYCVNADYDKLSERNVKKLQFKCKHCDETS